MSQTKDDLIALDLDGTLEDSRQDMVASVHRVRQTLDLAAMTDADVWPHVNRGMEHLYRTCFRERFSGDATTDQEQLQMLADTYETDYGAHIVDHTRLYDGMKHALQELYPMGHLAVVTNKPEQLSIKLLEHLGVRHLFSAIIGGDTCHEAKPSAIPYAEAASRCNFRSPRGQAFMIGDTAGDVKCGRAFGAVTIWCAWGYAEGPGDQEPHLRAGHPSELPGLIQNQLNTSR